MKRRFGALLALLLGLSACAGPSRPAPEPELRVLCTTYPVYLFTTAVADGVEEIQVDLLVNSQTSCLHDYTLTVDNMKAIEAADVIVMNGVGLEDFLDNALGQSDAAVIDCSAGVELLPTLEHAGHDGHDHEEEYDPHIWMDPENAISMVETIAGALSERDQAHQALYEANQAAALERLQKLDERLTAFLVTGSLSAPDGAVAAVDLPYWRQLITFHDGFQYFAKAYGFDLLKAIEEEEGSTASAAEIKEISALIGEYGLPAIFTEKNGSAATAKAISRETGCEVFELDMLMSGEGSGMGPYVDRMSANLNVILEAFQ